MTHLRTAECLRAEEAILDCMPAEAAALLAPGEGEIRRHLAGCRSCRELATQLAGLAAVEPASAPAALCARTVEAAAAEMRRSRLEARAAVRRASLRIALATLLCLPLLAGWALAVWELGAASLGALLPAALSSLVGALFAATWLAALSALAFTLTLIAGAAARQSRPVHLEV